ncbi:hypothetical protein [Solirubrum puertoriconensis]|uniref:Uncharacterized protein n=1 Tax=Solirubrum puertoriconensis TaxID=1751427 RepID=A0A9X0HK98_SOLP1|nr:hypothetical protein [Solirubrum puertoriconensis]KUG07428.1 hypothetical protein ASU33_13830 [Solirubrum puertoriconensis]
MTVRVTKDPYSIGQLFFVEIWTLPTKNIQLSGTPKTGATLLRTLTKNGPGDGTCSFDLSSALQTQFRHDTQRVPNPLLVYQKDETAYVAYYFRTGYITYNTQNQQVKNYRHESPVKVAVRAALPLDESGDMLGYVYQFDGEPVNFLTNMPDGIQRRRNEDTLLAFFLATNPDSSNVQIHVKADLQFKSAAPEQGYTLHTEEITSGGLYLINVKPERLVAHINYSHITSYSVYLDYEDEEQGTIRLSNQQEFQVAEEIPLPIPVLFMNRKGGWDSIQFRRDTDTEVKTKVNTFSSVSNTRAYQINSQKSVTYYSQWLTQAELRWLDDLKHSPAIYIGGKYQRPQDDTFKIDSSLGLSVINLTVSPAVEENSINL